MKTSGKLIIGSLLALSLVSGCGSSIPSSGTGNASSAKISPPLTKSQSIKQEANNLFIKKNVDEGLLAVSDDGKFIIAEISQDKSTDRLKALLKSHPRVKVRVLEKGQSYIPY